MSRPTETRQNTYHTRVSRQILRQNDPRFAQLEELCFASKNLYNCANYIRRQDYFNLNRWYSYQDLDKLVKTSDDEDCREALKHYRSLPAQVAQQILMVQNQNWTSFKALNKKYKKNPKSLSGKPKIPHYLEKDGRNLLIYTNQSFQVKDDYIILAKSEIKLSIPHLRDQKIQQVRILPRGTHFIVEIVYRIQKREENENPSVKIASIDLGLNNMITLVDNIGSQPKVIKGHVIKSVNQFYNKRKAHLQSILKKDYDRYTSKQLKIISLNRKQRIEDFFHKATKKIVDYCSKNEIDTLVVGYNPQWKTGINLGKKTNQNFVSIPFNKLLSILEYKCLDKGIKFVKNEESYTSKCSFLDREDIKKHRKYLGKRVTTKLFRSSKGIIINADVNGAYNILRKVVSNAFSKKETEEIRGVRLHPVRLMIFTEYRRPTKKKVLSKSITG